MQSIVRWCLNNRPVVILFTLVVMVAGVLSLFRLNQELLPSIDFPQVYVLVAAPGAGPQQVDRDITQPLVQGLTGLPHAKHIDSTSSQGFSQVAISFDLASNLKDDADAVNQRLSQVQLPSGAARPLVQTFSFNAVPSLTYAVSARDGDLARATQEANDVIVPALSGATGVAQVRVSGGAVPEVLVTLSGDRLAAYGISDQQVAQALSSANIALPVGTTVQTDKTVPVQVSGSVATISDLEKLVVGTRSVPAAAGPAAISPIGLGAQAAASPTAAAAAPVQPVTLADVAEVAPASQPVNGVSRTNQIPSLQIQVIRADGGNAVALSDDIRSRMAKLALNPADQVVLTYDAATDIRASLNDLILEGLIGATLAILIIFLFLGSLRATLVTAVSLPTSVLVALLGTALWGFSLNALTLAGLTIAVGRIVDDAIVVLENSYRHLQMGEPPRLAAEKGATEVSSAVISSTLTTVGVFLPIGLVGGIISKFFLPFSLTVTIALLASLLVALTLIPVLVTFFLKLKVDAAGKARVAASEGRLARGYRPVLGWTLTRGWRKAAVLALAVVALVLSAATLTQVPKNFFALGGSDQLTGTVTLPPGTSTDQTSAALKPFEEAAMADPGVKLVQATIASSDYGGYTAAYSSNVARISLIARSKKDADGVVRRMTRKLGELYGTGNFQLAVVNFGPPASGYTASVTGADPVALRQASEQIVSRLQQNAELANVKSDLAVEQPELLVTVDPARASAHDLSPQAVALVVGGALSARDLGTLGIGGPRLTVRVDPAYVAAGRLPDLPVGPGTTLKEVATISPATSPTTISRVDGVRQVSVNADILVADTQGASNRATASIEKLGLPTGVTLTTGGTQTDINDSFTQMFIAIGVAIGIVFLILVTFFRSVVTPFVILATMPLALIGSFLALYIFNQPLGLPALLGILMVFGIVVSNAILLVDFVERNRADKSLVEALLEAGAVRIRPILMTAVATIVALLPVAIGISSGGGGGLISQSLAIVVEGGLISSTGLTLVVIPIVYSLLKRRGGGRFRRPAEVRDPAPGKARSWGVVEGEAS